MKIPSATSLTRAVLAATALVAFPFTAAAQAYKVGDKHPAGGIVFSVDASGTKGIIVEEADSGPLTPPAAIAAGKAKGPGWGVPYLKDLRLVYQNLHLAGKGNFKAALYQSVDASSPQYRKGINFADGKEATGIAQNNLTLVRFVKAFSPGTAAAAAPANYTAQVKWGGESAPWVDQGDWVLGNRSGQRPIELKLASGDSGKTLMGQVKYAQKEGMLSLRMTRKAGNTYSAETKQGNNDWVKEGDWVVGGRKDQSVIALVVTSADSGQTLTGTVTYAGEGAIAFQAVAK